jgi:hypothetical protein
MSVLPTKTYRMTDTGHISSTKVDGEDAYVQSVWKVIHTERFLNPIYSENYGFELQDLFKESPSFAKSVIKLRLEDALKMDDRFISIENFEFIDWRDIPSYSVGESRYLDGTWYLNGIYALDGGAGSTAKEYISDRSTVCFRCGILSIYGTIDMLSYANLS